MDGYGRHPINVFWEEDGAISPLHFLPGSSSTTVFPQQPEVAVVTDGAASLVPVNADAAGQLFISVAVTVRAGLLFISAAGIGGGGAATAATGHTFVFGHGIAAGVVVV